MKILKELSAAFSPSGSEEAAGSIIAAEMEKAGFTVSTDVLGSVLCRKEGTGKKLLLTAFFDEPGFMVTDAEEDGTLCLRPTGGESVDGDVRVVTESGRVGTLKKEGNKFTAFIGEGTKEAALITAPIGSYLVFCSALKEGEVLEGKALSSRSGAAALIAAAKKIKTERDLYVLFASQHLSGSRGAFSASGTLSPDEVIAVGSVKGSGVYISAMDKRFIADKCVRDELIKLAPGAKVSVSDTVDSDAWAFPAAIAGAVLIGAENMGTPCEKVSASDINAAAELIKKYAERG